MIGAAILLCLVAALTFGPEHLAEVTGWSIRAVEYVASGLETAALWGFVTMATTGAIRSVAAFATIEAAARPVCRLALPMDRPPGLKPGQMLCDAAFGLDSIMISAPLAVAVALRVWQK